jgi:predicted GIY-YIG superfamily endonuclease
MPGRPSKSACAMRESEMSDEKNLPIYRESDYIDYYIYRLVDPRDSAVHYIGITSDVKARYRSHRHNRSNNPQKIAWIHDLQSQGLKPELEIIEQVFGETLARKHERDWICSYREQGAPLTNVYDNPLMRRQEKP